MSQGLTILKPLTVTDAMLVSSTVAESDYTAWSSATTYAKGARVRVVAADYHRVFESAQAGNTAHDPVSDDGTWWIDVGPTNRWKCFDASTSTQTAQAGSISYTLRPGAAVTGIAAVHVSGATSMRVRVVDPVYGTVYDTTFDMSPLPIASGWWEWTFAARRAPTLTVALDLPSYPNADLIIDFAGSAALAVGVLAIGTTVEIGQGVQYGARSGIQDYSRKETNDFGDTTLVRRAYAKRINLDLVLDAGEVDSAVETLADLRATPCIWIAASGAYAALVAFGFYKDFSVVISYPTLSDCSLEIEGLA